MMSALDVSFRNRIGLAVDEPITFETLDRMLKLTAVAVPFENLCVMEKRTADITAENLIKKIVTRHEGGLCYELNAILNLFLTEQGFRVSLVRGLVYDHIAQGWNSMGSTHVTNVVTHRGELYVVDTGFGANLPLTPVPLTGEVVRSDNGEFRVDSVDTAQGEYLLNVKLTRKNEDWKWGYAFSLKDVIVDLSELNVIQTTIMEHPASPFNKRPLLTKLTDDGSIILTDTSFIEWTHGKVEKTAIDRGGFQVLVADRFGMDYH